MAVFELPQVPQYVDDWIQTGKSHARTLLWSFNIKNPEMPHSMVDWLCDNTDNQELFARAWMDGYEVKEERSTEELFDNLKEMNLVIREHTCGIQVILDELSRRKKQNKEEK
ncbi:TPA_asm: DUF1642 domain-containing protein [Listeria monocytogenes]|nr:DUF1642 domain-containing protein [Listeria monocytogenes]HAC3601164.1 DUF1642 domain-containing protein [Listeria monocytogenes]